MIDGLSKRVASASNDRQKDGRAHRDLREWPIMDGLIYMCAVIYDSINTSGHVLACFLAKRLVLQ